MNCNRAVVVGAGVAGLIAAIELAAHGVEVVVLERARTPGGKMREIDFAGARVDAGPTVLTMRWVFEEFFDALGSSLAEHLTLRPLDVLARHAWSTDERLDLYADVERTVEAIAAFAGATEGEAYRRFCARAHLIYRTLEKPFLRAPLPSLAALIAGNGVRKFGNLWRISPFSSLWSALGTHFHDPRLQQLFGRYATYCGSSPMLAPATLMLIAHVEREGVWSVEGGMHRIAQALADFAVKLGVSIRYERDVTEVRVNAGRARAVRIADGEELAAGAVIVNADTTAVAAGALGPEIGRSLSTTAPVGRSLSAITWAMVATTRGFPLARHNVFFSGDYPAEFRDLFRNRRVPANPTVYVCAQDRLDGGPETGAAPERLLALINAPADGDQHAYTREEMGSYLSRTLKLMDHCGLRVQVSSGAIEATAPSDFDRMFPATGGALYGAPSHGWRASFMRPPARARIPGLYFAGGSTHPGPGVPMAALSGRLAAACVLSDMAPGKPVQVR